MLKNLTKENKVKKVKSNEIKVGKFKKVWKHGFLWFLF